MPVELSIVESVTALETTVVEVILESSSEPGPAGPGVPAGGTNNQVLTKQSATDYDTAWEDPTGGPGGGVTDADYLVGTAHGDLSAEIVVGTSPGGELGGTWAAPTVDATHSGSSHAGVQAAAEATAASALTAHEADTTAVHGIANTANLYSVGGTDVAIADGGTGASTAAGARANLDLEAGTDFPDLATFNDHSARHENGGADEISIAGLDGTPTELANHLSDAVDAHDASAISVADAGTFYTATDVEGVLAEIAPQLGGGSGESFQRDIAQTGHGLVVGNVVRHNGTSYVKAQANSAANAEVVGIVAAVADANNFTLHYGGRITGLSGLTAGNVYYLDDDTSGLLTATEPPDAGDVSKPLLMADSTTSGYFFNFRGALNVDMATQAELDAHVNDTSDAHDASAISVLDTAGDYTATDVEGVLAEIAPQLGGSASDPIADVFGAPDTAFEFNTSSLAGLTAIGTPDAEDANTSIPGHYFVAETNAANGMNGRYMASPTIPWTAVIKLTDANIEVNHNKAGIWYAANSAGSPGNLDFLMLYGATTTPKTERWTSPTVFGVNIAQVHNGGEPTIYFAIRVNSATDVDFMFSWNGWVWYGITMARNPAITIAYLGIGVSCESSTQVAAAFDYLRIWNSAKATPGAP